MRPRAWLPSGVDADVDVDPAARRPAAPPRTTLRGHHSTSDPPRSPQGTWPSAVPHCQGTCSLSCPHRTLRRGRPSEDPTWHLTPAVSTWHLALRGPTLSGYLLPLIPTQDTLRRGRPSEDPTWHLTNEVSTGHLALCGPSWYLLPLMSTQDTLRRGRPSKDPTGHLALCGASRYLLPLTSTQGTFSGEDDPPRTPQGTWPFTLQRPYRTFDPPGFSLGTCSAEDEPPRTQQSARVFEVPTGTLQRLHIAPNPRMSSPVPPRTTLLTAVTRRSSSTWLTWRVELGGG